MKMIRILALLAVGTALGFGADIKEDVLAAAQGWTQAAVKQDAAALSKWLADDLQYAHSGGQTQNKDQYVAAVMKGAPHYESFTFSDITVRSYGNAAVMTGFVDVKMPGRDSFRVRTLQVYTPKDGHWQMAAHQSTRLNQ
jgi:ketosteroid isomerase-like protein